LSQIGGLYVVLQEVPESDQAKNEEQSRNVYENKQNVDILPSKSSDILVESTRIVGHFGPKRQESSAILSPIDTNRRPFWHKLRSIAFALSPGSILHSLAPPPLPLTPNP
jgi:hypothetical protein